MQKIPVSKFKVRCLAILEEVRRTRQPVLVTRFGKPVAEVGPPPEAAREDGWIGAMRGTGRITGDVVSPASEPDEWEALRK